MESLARFRTETTECVELNDKEYLLAVIETGFSVQRGTVTTTDWETLPRDALETELAALCDDGDVCPLDPRGQ